MSDTLEDMIDLSSWIFAGLFLGLSVLGGFNLYQDIVNPSGLQLEVKPIDESDVPRSTQRQSYRPPEDFYLVQEYAPTGGDTGVSTTSDTKAVVKGGTEGPKGDSSSPVASELPFELVGTVTGRKSYRLAVIRNTQNRKSRTLKVGETWKPIRVEEIQSNRVVVTNTNKNRTEFLELSTSQDG